MVQKRLIRLTVWSIVLAVVAVGCTTQAPRQTPGQAPPEKRPLAKSPVKHQPDGQLVRDGKIKAKELGYNPIPVFIETEGGSLVITGGAEFTIRNNKIAWEEGDMAINVGPLPVLVAELILTQGEYAVVKNGAFVKLPGNLRSGM